MFENLIAKVFNRKSGEEVTEITSRSVVLEALCAYRDNLILNEDFESNLEVAAKLALVHQAIHDVWTTS